LRSTAGAAQRTGFARGGVRTYDVLQKERVALTINFAFCRWSGDTAIFSCCRVLPLSLGSLGGLIGAMLFIEEWLAAERGCERFDIAPTPCNRPQADLDLLRVYASLHAGIPRRARDRD